MPISDQFQPNDTFDKVATIASGETTSPMIDLGGVDPCAFFIPEFTGTAISFLASPNSGGTFYPVHANGGLYSLPVQPETAVASDNLAIMAGFRFIKIVSNATELAERTIVIGARPV